MKGAEFLDLAREVCRVHESAKCHLRERGLAAFQCSLSLWGVGLWVEVFFADSGADIMVSFDLVHPVLAVDVAAMRGDEDTVASWAASVSAGLWKCIKALERHPQMLAAREERALEALTSSGHPAQRRRL